MKGNSGMHRYRSIDREERGIERWRERVEWEEEEKGGRDGDRERNTRSQ